MQSTVYAATTPTVNRYVPVRSRIAAPFLSAYGVAPVAAPAPDPMASAITAACMNLFAGFAAKSETHRWIDVYTRGGRAVKPHWRRRAVRLSTVQG